VHTAQLFYWREIRKATPCGAPLMSEYASPVRASVSVLAAKCSYYSGHSTL